MAPSDPDFRTLVVAESIRLFSEGGYESTTVEQIAAAAGISRRTFFRQFRAKEDVIFADHEALLTQVGAFLAGEHDDPWEAVCAAAEMVFTHFRQDRELAFRRLRVVGEVPALRDRELVTTYRYQRMFEDFLRGCRPGVAPVHIVAYVSAITGAHNYLLRRMIRGDVEATLEILRVELQRVRLALGVSRRVNAPLARAEDPVVTVVTYSVGTPAADIARRVAEQLGEAGPGNGQSE